ncbi:MAG: DNA polymerase I [Chitinispirillaceae bacterium]|nr:DNA polymerase I [Chitinispirillaceae bacterium]
MQQKQLYLIDGYALIYRAYFALIKNPLTNSAGQPTGALYGFAGYLLRLLESYDCPYIAVAMDSPKPTFRHEMYDKYKANREEMPEELRSQIPFIRQFIDACNIPTVIQEGLEADDLIATLTRTATDAGFDVFLVTKDKDLMQLVGPHVTMLAPEGSGTLLPMGAAQVKEKMGVDPERIIDYLALTGDSSDNIPGVAGVGPKTALKILEQVESVEKLLDDTSVIANPKLKQKIDENRELLVLSKRLVTLKTDSPIVFSLDELARRPVNSDACAKLLREMECLSLLKSPLFARTPATPKAATASTTVVETAAALTTLAASIRRQGTCALLSFAEAASPIYGKRIGLSIALDESTAFYLPLLHGPGNNLPADAVAGFLHEVLASPSVKIIGHDIKREMHLALHDDAVFSGASFDCMVAAYLLDPGKRDYGMAALAGQWLMQPRTPIDSLFGSGKQRRGSESIVIDEAAGVLCTLARSLFALEKKLRPLLHERNVIRLFETVEMPLVAVLARLEHHGVRIDTACLTALSEEYGVRLAAIGDDIYTLAGETFNINSPKQIGEVLFDRLHLPGPKRTKTGAHATGIEILEKLAEKHPIARRILDYRELQKLLSTYIDALPAQIDRRSGRVHTSFNQTIAATGRLSSTDPNLQNIPIRSDDGKRIRDAFIPAEGTLLVSADYSQIELRILAHLSDDPLLKQAFAEDKDIHTQTASAIYGIFPEMITPEMRRAAKTINFGLMYGMGPINLARQIGTTFAEAKAFIEAYFHQFPTIKAYMESTIESARKLGYTETLLGRRRYLPDISASNRVVREAAERTAINTPVQGTAADIIKIAMINIDRSMPERFPGAKMLLQVHDELVFEVPEEAAERFRDWAKKAMSAAYQLSVPLKVDAGIGKNWNEAH